MLGGELGACALTTKARPHITPENKLWLVPGVHVSLARLLSWPRGDSQALRWVLVRCYRAPTVPGGLRAELRCLTAARRQTMLCHPDWCDPAPLLLPDL